MKLKRLLNLMEGTVIGFLSSGSLVIMGDAISGSSIGIAITLVLCMVVGGIVNRITVGLVGLIAGGSVVVLGNVVSPSMFGITIILLVGAFIGGLVAWE